VHSPCGHGVDYRQVVRQQIDIATKALSPTVNDRYTAVQVIDHLTVVCSDPAVRKLGADIRKALQDAAASSSSGTTL